MKNLVRILVSVLLILATVISLCACRDPYIESGEGTTTYDGVSLTVESIDYSSEHIKLNTKLVNNTLYEVTYGAEYVIERYVDGDWINSMSADVSFIEIAYVLSPLGTNEKSYSMQFADISRAGHYRIRVNCHVHENDKPVYTTLTANFKVDNELTLAGYHKLDYELDTWLYEDLRPYYKAGERVNVKIGKAYDIGFDLYLDGGELVMESWDGAYWQYSFIMPDHPARLTYETYDGMLG